MDYDLSFITSSGQDISTIMNNVEEIITTVSNGNNSMLNKYKGLSYDKYINVSQLFFDRCTLINEEMTGVIELLGLVQTHNAKRNERNNLKQEIQNLYSRLYYTYTDDEGIEHREENAGVRNSINSCEARVNTLNNELDQLISSIKGITGG